MRKQRIRVETGRKTPQAAGGSAWTTTATETLWTEVILITAVASERYQSIDKKIDYEFRFRGRPSITMRNTRFVWVTKGHPNRLKIYHPASAPENVDGVGRETSILVTESEEMADE
jgi:hypothetical protein